MPDLSMKPPAGNGISPPEADDAETEETPTKSALLPKNMFDGEPEPGATITLKVDAVYEDEVECSLAKEPITTEKPRMTADEEIEAAGEEME